MLNYQKFYRIWDELEDADRKTFHAVINKHTTDVYFKNIFSDYEIAELISLINRLRKATTFAQFLAASGYTKEKFADAFDMYPNLISRWVHNREYFPMKLRKEFAFYICCNFIESKHKCVCEKCKAEFLSVTKESECPHCKTSENRTDASEIVVTTVSEPTADVDVKMMTEATAESTTEKKEEISIGNGLKIEIIVKSCAETS